MAGYNDTLTKLALMDTRQHMLINPITSGDTQHIEEWMLSSAVTGEIIIGLSGDSASIYTLNFGGTKVIEFASKAELEQYVKDNAVELKLKEGTEHLTIGSGKTESGITTYTIGEDDIASASALTQEIADRTKADSDLKTELQGNIDKVAGSVQKIADSVYGAKGEEVDPDALFPRVEVLENALEYERNLRDEQKQNIDKEFKNVVYWDLPLKTDDEGNRLSGNTISLKQGDQLISSNSVSGVPLIYMSKWDGINVGGKANKYFDVTIDSAITNTSAYVSGSTRMTVNEKNYVAYLSDIDKVNEITSGLTEAIEKEVSARTAADEAIRGGAGLEDDGSYKANTGNSFTSGSATLAGAIDDLDEALSAFTIYQYTEDEMKMKSGYRHGYKLVDKNNKQHGADILIPDDQNMDSAWVGRETDKFKDYELTGETITGSTTSEVEYGDTGKVTLNLVYKVTDGTYTMVHIDFSSLIIDEQFGDGLKVTPADDIEDSDDYIVSVQIDEDSEDFITVGENGVKLSGVQAAIDAAKASATTVVEHATVNEHVTVSAKTEADGHTVYTVNEEDIASASALTQEITDRQTADTAIEGKLSAATDSLEGKITAEQTRAEAAENALSGFIETEKSERIAQDNSLSGLVHTEETRAKAAEDSLSGMIETVSGTTKSLQDELDATQVGAGLNGDGSYSADTSADYISGATSLKEADTKLATELKRVEDDAIFGVASGGTYDDCNLKLVTIDDHQYIDFTHMVIDCGTF